MNFLNRIFAFNSSRYRLQLENAAFSILVPDRVLVLDAGIGNAPYKGLFQHTQYESADFEKVDKQYAPSTFVCDLKSISVKDCRFDFIIFNQVMEHLPEPQLVLTELYRVLKVGGKTFIQDLCSMKSTSNHTTSIDIPNLACVTCSTQRAL